MLPRLERALRSIPVPEGKNALIPKPGIAVRQPIAKDRMNGGMRPLRGDNP